jgi:hypothetical protein
VNQPAYDRRNGRLGETARPGDFGPRNRRCITDNPQNPYRARLADQPARPMERAQHAMSIGLLGGLTNK